MNKLAITLEDLHKVVEQIIEDAPSDSTGLSKMGMNHLATMLTIKAFKESFFVDEESMNDRVMNPENKESA